MLQKIILTMKELKEEKRKEKVLTGAEAVVAAICSSVGCTGVLETVLWLTDTPSCPPAEILGTCI